MPGKPPNRQKNKGSGRSGELYVLSLNPNGEDNCPIIFVPAKDIPPEVRQKSSAISFEIDANGNIEASYSFPYSQHLGGRLFRPCQKGDNLSLTGVTGGKLHLLVCDADFSAQVFKGYTNQSLLVRLSQNGYELIRDVPVRFKDTLVAYNPEQKRMVTLAQFSGGFLSKPYVVLIGYNQIDGITGQNPIFQRLRETLAGIQARDPNVDVRRLFLLRCEAEPEFMAEFRELYSYSLGRFW